VEKADQRRTVAGNGHVAIVLPSPANASDQRTEAGGVHERHSGQVDENE
jgi:hypothetical protein